MPPSPPKNIQRKMTTCYGCRLFLLLNFKVKNKKRMTSNFEVRRNGKVYNLESIDAWYYSYNGIQGCVAGLGMVLVRVR